MLLVKETPTKDSSSKFPRFLFLYTKNKYKMSDRIKRVSLFMARNFEDEPYPRTENFQKCERPTFES